MKTKDAIALILCSTVCIAILAVVIGAAVRGPGTLPDETRTKMFELVTYILGVLSGWLMAQPKDTEK